MLLARTGLHFVRPAARKNSCTAFSVDHQWRPCGKTARLLLVTRATEQQEDDAWLKLLMFATRAATLQLPTARLPPGICELLLRYDRYTDELQREYGVDGFVQFARGRGGLPKVWLHHPSGHSLEVYLHGACITSWVKDTGSNILFVRPDASFDPDAAINSGIPLAFPQWREGTMVENGFADKLTWEVVEAGLGWETLGVEEDDVDWDEAELHADAEAHDVFPEDFERADTPPDEGAANELGAAEAGVDAATASEPVLEASASDVQEGDVLLQSAAVPDPAPYVVLRLTDNDYTRRVWPHSFELLYKIQLSEDDDFPDIQPPTTSEPFTEHEWDAPDDEGEEAEVPLRPTYQVLHNESDEYVPPPETPPVQVKMELLVTNTGEAGGAPMEFQAALLSHFAVRDLSRHASFVRALGLGGKNTFDYSHDPRFARLGFSEADYLGFGGGRVDTAFISSHDSDVKLCPGDRTHYELLVRDGFKDHIAYHPGPSVLGHNQSEWADHYTCLGVGRVAVPYRLPPGATWSAEYVIRYHNKYWDPPVWDRNSMQPMPRVPDGDPSEDSGTINFQDAETFEDLMIDE